MSKIEELIDSEEWTAARREINAALKKHPDDHWLLTRLGLTYYEQHRYQKALEIEEKALKISPECPLVLWDYAGTLQMLDQHKKSIKVFQKIMYYP